MKKSGKKKEPAKETGKRESKKSTCHHPEEIDNPFDFGGLPQRDLKKNLGCG